MYACMLVLPAPTPNAVLPCQQPKPTFVNATLSIAMNIPVAFNLHKGNSMQCMSSVHEPMLRKLPDDPKLLKEERQTVCLSESSCANPNSECSKLQSTDVIDMCYPSNQDQSLSAAARWNLLIYRACPQRDFDS